MTSCVWSDPTVFIIRLLVLLLSLLLLITVVGFVHKVLNSSLLMRGLCEVKQQLSVLSCSFRQPQDRDHVHRSRLSWIILTSVFVELKRKESRLQSRTYRVQDLSTRWIFQLPQSRSKITVCILLSAALPEFDIITTSSGCWPDNTMCDYTCIVY